MRAVNYWQIQNKLDRAAEEQADWRLDTSKVYNGLFEATFARLAGLLAVEVGRR